ILKPVLDQVNERRLAAGTQAIVYSSGFPYRVNVGQQQKASTDSPIKKYQKGYASLTGLTYLYQFILRDDPNYFGEVSNLYARQAFPRHFVNPFMQTEKREAFDAAKKLADASEHLSAADAFADLFSQFPDMPPLGILAAREYVSAERPDRAKEMIRAALAGGWNNRKYLRNDKQLSPIVQGMNLDALDELPTMVQPPIPFRSEMQYAVNGWPTKDPNNGVRYLMSCMLAVVHARGSTKAQAIEVLQTAARDRESRPKPEFWFTKTGDIRTKPRFPQVPEALVWINHFGGKCEILSSAMPKRGGTILGLMLGTPSTPLANRQWEFAPGAIADNLTSFSATFDQAAQSKITDLLHAGAAMASGPVYEPYTIPSKFPRPVTYGFYASGFSSIECFYLGLGNPFQTLVVGDPLCQPLAKPPANTVRHRIKDGNFQIAILEPAISPKSQKSQEPDKTIDATQQGTSSKLVAIQLYVDGVFNKTVAASKRLQFKVPDGFTADRLRLVLIGDDIARSQRSILFPKEAKN
ncbi:MAG: hypothetical protein AAF958_20185, partial [Planctomycetota bacterium]